MRYLLVGNPNTGKSTIFNLLTKSSRHTGNWHGVTVESFSKQVHGDEFVDTAGVYSLTNPVSIEEEGAVKTILDNSGIVLNVCDINNLERNLFLTIQLLSAKKKVVLILNQITKKSRKEINIQKLSEMLGISVVVTNGKNRKELLNLIKECSTKVNKKDFSIFSIEEIYLKVDEILKNCVKTIKANERGIADKIILNRFLCFFVFAFALFLTFYLTFSGFGLFLSTSIKNFVLYVASKITIKNEILHSFVFSCLLSGVTNVLCFMPQILILSFCLNMFEESGYLSRVAFMFDDLLARVGLSGKSIFSIIMGLGCTATAINTAQNMTEKSAKIKVAMLTPNISCSAKLPIYSAIGGAFFGGGNVFVILLLYLLGIIVLVVQANILKKIISSKEDFIMEFPPYRMPRMKAVVKAILKTGKDFLIKIGSVILIFSSIIWFMQNFSFSFGFVGAQSEKNMLISISKVLLPFFAPLGFKSWGIVASLLSGIVAKEMVVSTIGILNNVSSGVGLSVLNSGNPVNFSILSCISFLVFCLLYTPCITSISMQRQIVGRKWTFISALTQLVVAYVLAMLTYFLINVLSFEWAFVGLCFAILVFIAYVLISAKKCEKCENCKKCGKC